MDQPPIEIAREALRLEIDPAHGSVIRRFAWRQGGAEVDLLRPAPAGSTDPLDSGCFPLVPFSNRIGLGRFQWNGRTVQLHSNMMGGHAIHGHGWRRAWQVERHDAARALLAYDYEPGDWPFAYRAELSFELSDDALAATLTVKNRGDETMPAGLGFHPYFGRRQEGGLRADVSGVWLNSDTMLPVRHVAVQPPENLVGGWHPPGADYLDHCFTGWSGTATIDLSQAGKTLTLTGGGALRYLVAYAPDGADFFCAEPVSNINNAVNLRDQADTGLVALEPGAAMSTTMTLRVSA